jgi:hypothetical protein
MGFLLLFVLFVATVYVLARQRLTPRAKDSPPISLPQDAPWPLPPHDELWTPNTSTASHIAWPGVEMGLGAANPPRPPSPSVPVWKSSMAEADNRDDEDDDYDEFVEEMWRAPTRTFPAVTLRRNGVECGVVGVVETGRGYPYVNVWEKGRRKTFAGDGRHLWTRFGARIDSSAFLAIIGGEDPSKVLCADPYPQTLDEALQKDRIETKGRKFAIHYRNAEGSSSWRVISHVRRGEDSISACCHYRWGQHRHFRYDRLLAIVDLATGELIEVEDFASAPKTPGKIGKPSKAKPSGKHAS